MTTKLIAALMAGAMMLGPALAYDFMQKRDCTLETPTRVGVHTTCLIQGGMQGGTIDLSLSTPDGKHYALEGPIDGEDGHVFLLQGGHAKKTVNETTSETCYARNDGKLTICIGS